MYQTVASWIDGLALEQVSDDVIAFCFNLYDGCNDEDWSMELIGTDSFDADDSDWACGEVSDFGSRDGELKWKKNTNWESVQMEMAAVLSQYLHKGKFAGVLKEKAAVAVGFTDGDLEILFTK